MIIERTSFFAALASLVAGGAGGYYAGEHGLLRGAPGEGVTERQPSVPVAPAPSTPAVPVVESATAPAPRAPVCDDSLGSPAACPAPGYPAEEGEGCGAVPTKRCEDFKRTMKPRVAERAVDCLNALNPAQRCDSRRLDLCGHEALMNACEPEAATSASAQPDALTERCEAIARGCGAGALSPSLRECRATMAGLTELGRDAMASCMKAHCADKGLVGCEAVTEPR
ncbi:MAG: hypothetical protein ABSE49_16495 [Polyangiaceae bacterium]|jgi:hypothetical protein